MTSPSPTPRPASASASAPISPWFGSTCGQSPPPTVWSPISPSRSRPARPSAGPIPTTSLDPNSDRRQKMRLTVFAVMLLASTTMAFAPSAMGQGNAPFVPVNPNDTSPASALDDMPSKTISNGLVSAKVYLPDEFGFYRATRFDHAGMITHITYKGHDYGRYWYVKTSPNVQNFSYDADGLVAHNNNIAAGPVEEIGENGFDEFIANDPSGYGYSYSKTVRLVHGKPTLIIEDRLKNTGKKPIDTTVYNHHFMTISPGEEAVQLEAPFALKNTRPMPADVI